MKRMKTLLTELMFPLIAVVAAFLFGGIIVWLVGDSPLLVYELFFTSAFGSLDGIGYTLFYATPLIFTGLAVAVAFKCGLLNIGAEGQLITAAFATAWVGLVLPNWPAIIVLVLAMLAAVLVGGVWAGIPGVLKAKFGAHEVITTIMMNFIAVGLVSYLTQYHYRKVGDPILETFPIAEKVDGVLVGPHIPRMSALLGWVGISFPDRLPLNLVMAMFISGMLAGMVGINEVLGYRYRYYHDFSASYGFTGIAVALLGRSHPAGVLVAAILFGALIRSGLFIDIFTDHVSKDWVVILQAIIILFVACEGIFRRRWKRA